MSGILKNGAPKTASILIAVLLLSAVPSPSDAATLLSDTFTGTTISTANWTETDTGGLGGTTGNIQQNGSASLTGGSVWGENYLLSVSAYDRSLGSLSMEADVTCNSSGSIMGIGYGDPGILTGGGQSYTMYAVSNTLYFSRQQSNSNAENTPIGSCTNGVPFHIKIAIGTTTGASIYIDNSGTPAATLSGGTFNNKSFFLEGHSGITYVDNVVVSGPNAASAPDAPSSLEAIPASGQMALAWTAPASNGGSAITDYLVEYKATASGSWLTFTDGTSTTTAATVTGLTNSTGYDFRVSAINAIGTSTPSSVATGTPDLAVPSAPRSLAAITGTSAQIALTWTAPLSNGGASVTDYIVEYKTAATSTWSTFADGVSATTGATVTGLSNGTSYNFRVTAVNSVGNGTVSSTVTATPSFFVLSDDFTGTTIDTAKWTEKDTGGLGGTSGYVQQNGVLNVTGTDSWGGAGLSTVDTYDRTNGDTSMSVSITRSQCGSGVGSVAIGYGDLDFTVGGSASYILLNNSSNWELYYWNNGGNVSGSGGAASPQTLSGLTSCTNGVPFTLTLKALQGGGASVYVDGSDTPSATITAGTFTNKSFWLGAKTSSGTSDLDTVQITAPVAGPFAPTGLSATAGDGQASLSWTSGGDNGATITDYTIEYRLSGAGSWSTFADGVSATTGATVTGLTNGRTYNFRVYADNANGTSTVSSATNATPVSATPSAPVASSVQIAGSASVGELLVGSFTYSDPNANSQGVSTYRWLRSDTSNGTYAAISGATGTSYTLTSSDLNKYIKFEVTPVATVAPTTGTAALSAASGPVGASVPYINEIISTGQSLSVGVGGSPALSTTQPYENVMLTGAGGGMGAGSSFTPLVESSVETMGSALANTITANVPGNDYTIALTNHGVSGYPYSQLKKGTSPYSTGMTQVTNVKAAATSAGKTSRVVAITSVHGETDNYNGVDGPTYEGYLEEWQHDLEADSQAITGQSTPIPLFIDQMSSYFSSYANTPTSEIPIYQLKASEDNVGKIYLVTPKYFFNYSDRHHLTNESYRWLGEYYGKVIKKVIVDGDSWRPLSPDSVTRSGAVIYAKFHVPAGVLTFDTTIEQAIANKGFEYYDSTNSASISSVAIVSDDTVAITLNQTPTGSNQRLRYAYTGTAGVDAGSHSAGAAGGNLRDTDSFPSAYGNTLYDWAVHFDEAISVDNTAPVLSSVTSTGTSNTGTTITWNTDEAATTKVQYGVSTAYGVTTPITDSSGTLSHSATLSGLTACSQYHYRVISSDPTLNTATSSDATFTTTGCTGNVGAGSTSATDAATSTASTLSLTTSGTEGLTLNIPMAFSSTTASATFQAKQLATDDFFAAVAAPGTLTPIGDFVYNLKALVNASTTLSSFDQPLTITMSYDPAGLGTVSESSLVIYRYDGSAWHPLTGCVVDTGAHTVSCTTTAFSDFSLFGQATASQSSSSSRSRSRSSLLHYGCKDPKAQNYEEFAASNPSLCTYASTTAPTTALVSTGLTFTRDLTLNMTGPDVRALQELLIHGGYLMNQPSTGLFGPLTKQALIAYQTAKGITPPSGYFGPLTRASFTGTISTQTASAPVTAPSTTTFTRDLEAGVIGEDVRALQQYLNKNGFMVSASGPGSAGNETTKFGAGTQAALIKFQVAHGILPASGYFGAKTRAVAGI